MDPTTFAQRVSSQEKNDPELGNWAHRYLENSALQTLRAAFYIEDAGSAVLEDYRTTLRSTLASLPEHVNLEVSQRLFDLLVRIAGSDLKDLLDSKVKTANS